MESTRNVWLRLASAGFLIVIPVLMAAIAAGLVTYWGFGVNNIGQNTIVLFDTPPVPERRVYGLVAALVPSAFMIAGLWHLFRMFLGFRTADTVEARTIRHLKGFAKFTLIAVFVAFLLSGVMRWAMGLFDHAPLWTHLGFSVAHAAVMFCASIIYVSASVIEEGYAYKREMEEYV